MRLTTSPLGGLTSENKIIKKHLNFWFWRVWVTCDGEKAFGL